MEAKAALLIKGDGLRKLRYLRLIEASRKIPGNNIVVVT
jgi:hypothetical protein